VTLFGPRVAGRALAFLASLACLATVVAAQPPLGQMSGIPLPDSQLPDATVTVRIIRGAVTNNVAGQEVQLRQGDVVETATTDSEGRATFLTLTAGEQAQASTVLDSQLLQSQAFAVPGRGGVRLMLVGADPDVPVVPDVPSRPGAVSFGEDSWAQIELVEGSIEVYYFFEVVNPGDAPVDSAVPIVLDLPDGAEGTTVLQGSAPRTVASGPRVELPGPFDPGVTPLHVAYILPYSGESLVVSQPLPVDLDSVLVSVEKWGTMDFVSRQVERRMEVPSETPSRSPYVVGAGPAIRNGEPLVLELVGLPHRSTLPTTVTLVIAACIVGFGVWTSSGSVGPTSGSKRGQALEGRREKLFADLVKVERQHRAGTIGSTKHSSRRDELVRALEKVYRELEASPIS
jgi:hypothetical protein